jgi:hypothetical protein
MGLRKLISKIIMNDRGISIALSKKRVMLSEALSRNMRHTVKYGPFKGLRFTQESWWWGAADRSSMLLGIYEKEVLEALMKVPKKYNVFIDLGAADGYYSIGTLVSKKFKKGYSFEMSDKGRQVILKNAILNKVDKSLNIFSEAKKDFYKAIPRSDLDKAIFLVDIEGGEFNLFDKKVFNDLKKSIIFIEIHDWFFKDGDKKLNKLISDAKKFFNISKLTTSSRDLSVFPELSKLHDSERWLIASEGRHRLMVWLRFDPK